MSLKAPPPDGAGRAIFRIAKDMLLQHFRRTGNAAMLQDGMLIPAICDAPTAVFQGLRPGHEDALCYCGVPSARYLKEKRIELPFPPGRVMLVFATPDLKITKFGLEREDKNRAGFPEGYETRFGRRLWPKD